MNKTPTHEPNRMNALRNELVATVNAAPYTARRFQPRVIGAAIGVFALAGALTGGAISATALATASHSTVTVDVEAMASEFVGTHTKLFGTPFILSGQGETSIEMGTRPVGATSIAVTLRCLDVGTFTTAFNGDYDSGLSCTQDDTATEKSTFGGMSSHHGVHGDKPQTLTVDSGGSDRYVVWASWAAKALAPPASAAQLSELADGEVSRAEYDAAFDRFASCMAAAGYPVQGSSRTGTLIQYSLSGASVHAGVDTQCYDAEFKEVDIAWQQNHQG
jgi:hypothetical protein